MLPPILQYEVSIDDYVDSEHTSRLDSFLADPSAESHVQKIQDREVAHLVKKALVTLDERERHIIRNRFGLLGGKEQTLEQIGEFLSLSRERVRQLERQAKNKLRPLLLCLQPHIA
jgi:RNA polymerase sigma factor (sigma-70 family)